MKKLSLLLITSVGIAGADEPPAGKVPAELRSCVGIERNIERLACFDRGVAALMGTANATAPSAESSFGLVASAPRVEAARNPEVSEDLKKLTAKVTALSTAKDGSVVLTLDNGQVWRQLSGGQLLIKVGDEVQINRAALGSFQMLVPTGRSGKVKRVR
jgi:hypothetical protein